MKMIISPAKKMNVDTDTFSVEKLPALLRDTEQIREWMQKLSYEKAKKLWGCNDSLAKLNFQRFQEMELDKNLTPAILSYEGIQYQFIAPRIFTQEELEYVQEHVRILSGFYGVLKPLDGVVPYRLEMQAKAHVAGTKNLYDFWGDRLYCAVQDEERVIVNLASQEYAKCIVPYLRPQDQFLTCIFGEWKNGRVIQKGTQAKMARGEMVRFMAQNRVKKPAELKAFDHLGYCFEDRLSSDTEYVFVKGE